MWSVMRFQTAFVFTLALCTDCSGLTAVVPHAEILSKANVYEVGETATLTCKLKSARYDVGDIRFETSSGHVLNINVSGNEILTTIGPLTLSNDNERFYCRYFNMSKSRTLAVKRIHVGYPPEAPSNITCVSYNLISMRCDFAYTPERKDNLRTNWTIEYTHRDVGGQFRVCHTKQKTTCVLGSSGRNEINPFLPDKFHIFRVTVANKLGSKKRLFEVEPSLIIQPDRLDGVRVTSLNSTCLNVTWVYPSLTFYDLEYILTVVSSFQPPRQVQKSGRISWMLVPDLVPYSQVNITIQCRPLHGGYLSDPRIVSIWMPEDKPSPPTLPAGSYSVMSETDGIRQIQLYWQGTPRHLQHGIITQYRLSVYKGPSPSVNFTQNCTNASVSTLVQYPFENDSDYRIALQAKNRNGYSRQVSSAEIFIPALTKVPTSVTWVDTEFVAAATYTVYWSPGLRKESSSILRVFWCFGHWKTVNEVYCKTDIEMKTVMEVIRHQTDIHVGKDPNNCETCTWNFGVSVETNGLSPGIVWNKCRFKKYEAPELTHTDITISHVNMTSVTVTWYHPCWHVFYIGRPDYYEIGLSSSPKQCHNGNVMRIPASHESMTATLSIGGNTGGIVCVRPVGGSKAGKWVKETFQGQTPVITSPLLEITVGSSVTFFLLLVVLLMLYLCKKRKCFAKIHIEVPVVITKEYPLAEEKCFPPPPAVVTEIRPTKKGKPPDVSEPFRSSIDSAETKETGLSGNTTSHESYGVRSLPINSDSVSKHFSDTDSKIPYATITAWRHSTSSDRYSIESESDRGKTETDCSYVKTCVGGEQMAEKDDISVQCEGVCLRVPQRTENRESSYEDLSDTKDLSYDGSNYLHMKRTTNEKTGCNVYYEIQQSAPIQEKENKTFGAPPEHRCTCDVTSYGNWPQSTFKQVSEYIDNNTQYPLYSQGRGLGLSEITHQCNACKCGTRMGHSNTTHNQNINTWLRSLAPTWTTPTSVCPRDPRQSVDPDNNHLSEAEEYDPLLYEKNSCLNYVKMSNVDEVETDISNGNITSCGDYSLVAMEDYVE